MEGTGAKVNLTYKGSLFLSSASLLLVSLSLLIHHLIFLNGKQQELLHSAISLKLFILILKPSI